MKITKVIETEFDTGDYVIFKKDETLLVGRIEGFNLDGDYVWYNIRVNKNRVLTYVDSGDVAEWDIICKLTEEQIEKVKDEFER